MLNAVLHQVPGQVVPRAGDVIVAAALAAVDLKGLEFSVPLVVFDIEVGEAGKADRLQERPQLFAQLRRALGDDDGVVADGMVGMLLQQHMAHAHQADLAVRAGVVGDHPHKAVVSGDKVLEDQGILIPRPVDVVDDLIHLRAGLEHVGLLLGGEGMLPVGVRLGGLDHKGAVEGQGEVVTHALVIDHGVGIIDAVLLAELIKALLVDERLQQVQRHIGRHDVARKAGQVGGDGVEVVIPAAQHQNGFVRVRPGHLGDVLQHRVRPVVVRAHPVVDDGAAGADAGRVHAVYHALDAVGLVEGAGHAVGVDIGAEQHGDEFSCHVGTPPER